MTWNVNLHISHRSKNGWISVIWHYEGSLSVVPVCWHLGFCLQSRGLQRSKIIFQASNSWLAEQNLIYQPYLAKTKLLLAEKHRDLGELVSSIRRKQRKLGKVWMWDCFLLCKSHGYYIGHLSWHFLCHMQRLYSRDSTFEWSIHHLKRRSIFPWENQRWSSSKFIKPWFKTHACSQL